MVHFLGGDAGAVSHSILRAGAKYRRCAPSVCVISYGRKLAVDADGLSCAGAALKVSEWAWGGSDPGHCGSLGVRCIKMEAEERFTISLSAQVPFVRVRFRVSKALVAFAQR